ncbi:MAG: protease modulator HflC, partial [Gammaproteobacteria bacterium]|nr:protease modulator HflC [Gammaproteobacteria bacterium]
MNNIKFLFAMLGLIFAVIWFSTFIVTEKEVAIKFKLGEIVESDYPPGLYWQIPIINNVIKFDSRILTLDTP